MLFSACEAPCHDDGVECKLKGSGPKTYEPQSAHVAILWQTIVVGKPLYESTFGCMLPGLCNVSGNGKVNASVEMEMAKHLTNASGSWPFKE